MSSWMPEEWSIWLILLLICYYAVEQDSEVYEWIVIDHQNIDLREKIVVTDHSMIEMTAWIIQASWWVCYVYEV